jgi:hypothetical protein
MPTTEARACLHLPFRALTHLQHTLNSTTATQATPHQAPNTSTKSTKMSIFADKAAFVELGLDVIAPSSAHMYQDCYICKDPLNVNVHTTATDKHHAAVRIGVCGHMHGQECLSAWLDVGNSCPTCKRLLFEGSNRAVSQSDINKVVYSLRHLFGEKRVMAAIARLAGKRVAEQAQQQRTREEEVKKLKAKEIQAQNNLMDDADWMNSDDGEDFGEEDDEDFEMGEEDEDSDGVVLDEEVEPQSAKA